MIEEEIVAMTINAFKIIGKIFPFREKNSNFKRD